MRHVKIINKCLIGSRNVGTGDTLALDDKTAARIVGAGHASYLAPIQGPDVEVETADAPRPGEKAIARRPR